jgi:prevent-host-death family protein
METIGAYDAKTHLPRLLASVAQGHSVTITKHGVPIARLVPVSGRAGSVDDVIEAVKQSRQGIRRGRRSVRSMIEEGRR